MASRRREGRRAPGTTPAAHSSLPRRSAGAVTTRTDACRSEMNASGRRRRPAIGASRCNLEILGEMRYELAPIMLQAIIEVPVCWLSSLGFAVREDD